VATFLQMQTSVYAVLRDSEKAFVLAAEVKEWLNEAQLDYVARTGVLEKTATASTAAGGTVALPSDLIRITSFAVDSDDDGVADTQVELVNDDVFLSYKLGGGTPSRTLGRILGANIETYPVVASEVYVLEYVYAPPTLTADGDIAAIPVETHIRMINYARAHAKWKEGEAGEGETYMSFYLDGLPSSPSGQYRSRPGPFSFVPEMGYWDEVYWDGV
jgi:hypothetical protein